MVKTSLLIAPVFDDITVYSLPWAEEVEKALNNPTVIKGRAVTRNEVEKACEGKDLFIFYDHGSETALYGSNTEQIVNLNNISKLPKEVYTMACFSAKDLGIEIWRLGKVFWGYYEPFSFTTDSLPEFQRFANNGILLKLKGSTWKEALDKTRTLGKELADKLTEDNKFIASICMSEDTSILRCYNGEPPADSNCFFRRLALKIFGVRGWTLTKTRVLATILFGTGLGVSLQHSCAGIVTMVIAFVLCWYDFLKVMK